MEGKCSDGSRDRAEEAQERPEENLEDQNQVFLVDDGDDEENWNKNEDPTLWYDENTFSCRHCNHFANNRAEMARHVADRHSTEDSGYDCVTQVLHSCQLCGDEVLCEFDTLSAHLANHKMSLENYGDAFGFSQSPLDLGYDPSQQDPEPSGSLDENYCQSSISKGINHSKAMKKKNRSIDSDEMPKRAKKFNQYSEDHEDQANDDDQGQEDGFNGNGDANSNDDDEDDDINGSRKGKKGIYITNNPDEACVYQCNLCRMKMPYAKMAAHLKAEHDAPMKKNYTLVRKTWHRCMFCGKVIVFSTTNLRQHSSTCSQWTGCSFKEYWKNLSKNSKKGSKKFSETGPSSGNGGTDPSPSNSDYFEPQPGPSHRMDNGPVKRGRGRPANNKRPSADLSPSQDGSSSEENHGPGPSSAKRRPRRSMQKPNYRAMENTGAYDDSSDDDRPPNGTPGGFQVPCTVSRRIPISKFLIQYDQDDDPPPAVVKTGRTNQDFIATGSGFIPLHHGYQEMVNPGQNDSQSRSESREGAEQADQQQVNGSGPSPSNDCSGGASSSQLDATGSAGHHNDAVATSGSSSAETRRDESTSNASTSQDERSASPSEDKPIGSQNNPPSLGTEDLFLCPFDPCDFTCNLEGIRNGVASSHCIKTHRAPVTVLRRRGLKWRKVVAAQ